MKTLPSKISIDIDLETTSLEAKSLALGAYLSIKRSPKLFLNIPPSPLDPSVYINKLYYNYTIKHPLPYIPVG